MSRHRKNAVSYGGWNVRRTLAVGPAVQIGDQWFCRCSPKPHLLRAHLTKEVVAVLSKWQVPSNATVMTVECRCGVVQVPARAFGIITRTL